MISSKKIVILTLISVFVLIAIIYVYRYKIEKFTDVTEDNPLILYSGSNYTGIKTIIQNQMELDSHLGQIGSFKILNGNELIIKHKCGGINSENHQETFIFKGDTAELNICGWVGVVKTENSSFTIKKM